MAKGTLRGLPGPDDPMFREGWGISLLGGPRKPGAKQGGESPPGSQGVTSPKVEGPQSEGS
jgi:hypothetical protein